jgi:uncharacterized protein HemY
MLTGVGFIAAVLVVIYMVGTLIEMFMDIAAGLYGWWVNRRR